MGLYFRLGRRRALWVEWRREWALLAWDRHDVRGETVLQAPYMQIIYTPERSGLA